VSGDENKPIRVPQNPDHPFLSVAVQLGRWYAQSPVTKCFWPFEEDEGRDVCGVEGKFHHFENELF
jgi:hypothetical protein